MIGWTVQAATRPTLAGDPDYVRSVIARFPEEERKEMVGEDGLIRVDCAFCSSSFPIAPGDVG